MKIFKMVFSLFSKWKLLKLGSFATIIFPLMQRLVGQDFLTQQIQSYAKAKKLLKQILIGASILIGIVFILVITLLALLINKLLT